MGMSNYMMHVGVEGSWWVVKLEGGTEVMRVHRRFLPAGAEGQKLVAEFTRECIISWVKARTGAEDVVGSTRIVEEDEKEFLDKKRGN